MQCLDSTKCWLQLPRLNSRSVLAHASKICDWVKMILFTKLRVLLFWGPVNECMPRKISVTISFNNSRIIIAYKQAFIIIVYPCTLLLLINFIKTTDKLQSIVNTDLLNSNYPSHLFQIFRPNCKNFAAHIQKYAEHSYSENCFRSLTFQTQKTANGKLWLQIAQINELNWK